MSILHVRSKLINFGLLVSYATSECLLLLILFIFPGYISGWKGTELTFDELPQDAERVEHDSATGWTEMWKRGQDVNRLTDKNGCLTINNFTSSDAGTYRVLNEEGGTLVTVIITGERK